MAISLPEAQILDNPLFRVLVLQTKAISRSLLGVEAEFDAVESAGLQVANLAVREFLQGDLQRRSDGLAEELLIDGVLYGQHLSGSVAYHSLCGTLKPSRFTYRAVGVRNGPTVVPLELAASLVETATPGLAYAIALGYAKDDLRSYEETAKADHRVPPSRSTMEEIAKAVGSHAQVAAPRIEAYVRRSETLPEGATGVSLGLDRVAVPMEEDRTEGAPPKTRRKSRTASYERMKPLPVDVNFRMAYVGTVSTVDKEGRELITRRYTALPEEGPEEVVRRMMADVKNARQQNPALEVGIVQDGAPELWTAVRRGLQGIGVTKFNELIDRYHVNERLGNALRIVESNAQRRKQILSDWNDYLDRSDRAAGEIAQWLGERIEVVETRKSKAEAEEYLRHVVYIEKNEEEGRLRYRTTIKRGLPIGSGATEGSCKSVVGQRVCGSGQRWRPDGIAAVLTLRAIHRSARFPSFWAHLAKRYTAELRPAA